MFYKDIAVPSYIRETLGKKIDGPFMPGFFQDSRRKTNGQKMEFCEVEMKVKTGKKEKSAPVTD